MASSIIGSAAPEERVVVTEFEIRPLPVRPVVVPEYPPNYNFALAENGAVASGGGSPGLLNDGNFINYTGGTGFAMTLWRANQSFLVTLKKPVCIDCVRFLLWDKDDRFYRYKLEVCADEKGEKWVSVADKSGEKEQCKSWQLVKFPEQTVKIIRLTGTFNSANDGFHVVELQAFLNPDIPAVGSSSSESLEF